MDLWAVALNTSYFEDLLRRIDGNESVIADLDTFDTIELKGRVPDPATR